ncbi:MAG: hypothetical protein AAF993_05640 [Pseudomonadota bacterium]
MQTAHWTQLDTTPHSLWQQLRALQPSWYYSAIGYFAFALCCLAAQAVDERLLLGVSVWTKPFKFALSISVYFATLLVFAQYTPTNFFQTWRGKLLAGIPVVTALFEMAYIAIQAGLGQHSHFNDSTMFHQIMYSLMGIGATSMVVVLVWLAWVIGRQQTISQPLILSIVLGLVATCLFGGGFGGYLGAQTSHWVNASATDANGILLFNWARDGGDLRVAHFFGMHAMQAIPLFAWLLPSRLQANTACALVIAFTCAYCAFTTVTFVQAIQGLPFLA